MSIEASYFAVMVHTSPFTFGKEKEIGCYSTKNVATKVANFVRYAFQGQVNGGMDISIRTYNGKVMRTNAGLRLADTPMGCLTMIGESWNSQEVERVLNFVPFVVNSNELKRRLVSRANGIVDQPKLICEDVYHCVVLTFEPFDDSHKLYAGYYKSKNVAHSVAMFIMNIHHGEKVGAGFDMDIISTSGRYVEYDSGKSYVKVDGVDQEIKSSCESEEYLRLTKTINESIKKWSCNVYATLDQQTG